MRAHLYTRTAHLTLALAVSAVLTLLTGCGHNDARPDLRTAPIVNASPNDILFRAISLVGTPYRYGGNTPQGGFDCSGLIGYIFRDIAGVELPRSAQSISELRARRVARNDLAPGDLVFFRDGHDISHIGIYVGEGRFVHAPRSGGTVRLDALDGHYWNEHFSGAKRLW